MAKKTSVLSFFLKTTLLTDGEGERKREIQRKRCALFLSFFESFRFRLFALGDSNLCKEKRRGTRERRRRVSMKEEVKEKEAGEKKRKDSQDRK